MFVNINELLSTGRMGGLVANHGGNGTAFSRGGKMRAWIDGDAKLAYRVNPATNQLERLVLNCDGDTLCGKCRAEAERKIMADNASMDGYEDTGVDYMEDDVLTPHRPKAEEDDLELDRKHRMVVNRYNLDDDSPYGDYDASDDVLPLPSTKW